MKLATLCYLKADDRTLMLHRIKKQGDMHAGKWNGLGGKLAPGETPEQCVIREVAEESGFNIKNPLLRGVLTFPAFSKNEDWYVFVFVAREFSGEMIDSDEGVLRWIDDADLLTLNLWEGDKIFLHWLDREAFFSGQFSYTDGNLREYSAVFYSAQQVVQAESVTDIGQLPPKPTPPSFQPVYQPVDDTYCWMCNGPVVKRHCNIIREPRMHR
jgi:8-oxo-dGTP diphosphatase